MKGEGGYQIPVPSLNLTQIPVPSLTVVQIPVTKSKIPNLIPVLMQSFPFSQCSHSHFPSAFIPIFPMQSSHFPSVVIPIFPVQSFPFSQSKKRKNPSFRFTPSRPSLLHQQPNWLLGSLSFYFKVNDCRR